MHTPAAIVFQVGETVGQCESQLSDWIGASFSNVVTADGDRIVVAY